MDIWNEIAATSNGKIRIQGGGILFDTTQINNPKQFVVDLLQTLAQHEANINATKPESERTFTYLPAISSSPTIDEKNGLHMFVEYRVRVLVPLQKMNVL